MQNKIEDLFLGKILQNVVYLTSISHADKARAVMFDVKVLIQEGVSNIDTSTPCTISVLEVTTCRTISYRKNKKYNDHSLLNSKENGSSLKWIFGNSKFPQKTYLKFPQ